MTVLHEMLPYPYTKLFTRLLLVTTTCEKYSQAFQHLLSIHILRLVLQFPFVVTSTANDDTEDDDDADVDAVYDYSKNAPIVTNSSSSSLTSAGKFIKHKLNFLEAFLQTEMWGIFVSMVMQDGPYAIMRLISILAYGIVTYTNYFFTGKNVFVLLLQLYRLLSIYHESKQKRQEEREQKRVLKLAKLYEGAFLAQQRRSENAQQCQTSVESQHDPEKTDFTYFVK